MCAIAIVFSASASLIDTKEFVDLQKKEVKVKKGPKKSVKAAPFKSLKQSNKIALTTPSKDMMAKAPKAKNEVIDVTIVSWDLEDWGEDGELYLNGENDEYGFYFDLIYGGENEDLELGKVYTVEDVYVSAETGEQYAAVWYDEDWHYGIKTLSLTKTIDEAGLVHFAGSVVDSLDAEFTFHYDESPIAPGEYDFAATEASFRYYASDNDAYYTLRDADGNVLHFDIVLGADSALQDVVLDSVYTIESMLAKYTTVTYNKYSSTLVEVSFVKSIALDGTLTISGVAADTLGRIFNYYYSFKAPEAENFDTIVAACTYKKEAGWFWYDHIITAEDENNAVELDLLTWDGSCIGTWTEEDFEGVVRNLVSDEEYDIYSGSITIEATADGYAITGALLCMNNTEYALDLTYTKPSANRTDTIVSTTGAVTLYEGAWQMVAFNADNSRYVSIAAYDDFKAGQYTFADLAEDYTYAAALGEDTVFFSLINANLTITYDAATGLAHFTGSLVAQNDDDAADVPEFVLDITASVKASGKEYDTEDADFIHDFATYEIDETNLAEYNSLYITAMDGYDFYLVLDLTLAEGATGLEAGVYPVADDYYYQSVFAGFYNEQYGVLPSYAATLVEQDSKLYLNDLWFLTEGNVTVNADGSIDVEAVNSYDRVIRCHLAAAPGVENVEAGAAAVKRMVNGVLVIEKNGVQYNAQGAVVK